MEYPLLISSVVLMEINKGDRWRLILPLMLSPNNLSFGFQILANINFGFRQRDGYQGVVWRLYPVGPHTPHSSTAIILPFQLSVHAPKDRIIESSNLNTEHCTRRPFSLSPSTQGPFRFSLLPRLHFSYQPLNYLLVRTSFGSILLCYLLPLSTIHHSRITNSILISLIGNLALSRSLDYLARHRIVSALSLFYR